MKIKFRRRAASRIATLAIVSSALVAGCSPGASLDPAKAEPRIFSVTPVTQPPAQRAGEAPASDTQDPVSLEDATAFARDVLKSLGSDFGDLDARGQIIGEPEPSLDAYRFFAEKARIWVNPRRHWVRWEGIYPGDQSGERMAAEQGMARAEAILTRLGLQPGKDVELRNATSPSFRWQETVVEAYWIRADGFRDERLAAYFRFQNDSGRLSGFEVTLKPSRPVSAPFTSEQATDIAYDATWRALWDSDLAFTMVPPFPSRDEFRKSAKRVLKRRIVYSLDYAERMNAPEYPVFEFRIGGTQAIIDASTGEVLYAKGPGPSSLYRPDAPWVRDMKRPTGRQETLEETMGNPPPYRTPSGAARVATNERERLSILQEWAAKARLDIDPSAWAGPRQWMKTSTGEVLDIEGWRLWTGPEQTAFAAMRPERFMDRAVTVGRPISYDQAVGAAAKALEAFGLRYGQDFDDRLRRSEAERYPEFTDQVTKNGMRTIRFRPTSLNGFPRPGRTALVFLDAATGECVGLTVQLRPVPELEPADRVISFAQAAEIAWKKGQSLESKELAARIEIRSREDFEAGGMPLFSVLDRPSIEFFKVPPPPARLTTGKVAAAVYAFRYGGLSILVHANSGQVVEVSPGDDAKLFHLYSGPASFSWYQEIDGRREWYRSPMNERRGRTSPPPRSGSGSGNTRRL